VDLDHINEAAARARRNAPGLDFAVIEFVASLLRLEWPTDMEKALRQRAREWVLRFQQLSGPVTAKGLEDTAFYNYNRLVSLNEVGGNPGEFGLNVERFHQYNTMKGCSWPHSLLASATHDTKRGEDLRARLNVLSEIPDVWDRALKRWQRLNAPKKSWLDGHPAPHPNDEYLLYQMLVGAWPMEPASKAEPFAAWLPGFRKRIVAYMAKAVKEAKARTSWTEPNSAYEEAVTRFVEQLLDERAGNDFLSDLRSFQRPITFFGQINSLAQTVLKIASPGVPDFYQGTELWDLNLVDPDNRRPVDYARRERMLEEIRAAAENLPAACARFWAERHTGAVKLFAIWRALAARTAHRDIFELGEYLPLSAEGRCARHLCAFARRRDGKCVVAVVPRLLCTLAGGPSGKPRATLWRDTTVPLPSAQTLRNVFTGEAFSSTDNLDPAALFRHFPVALLVPL
jgi:(1->4)-alpha-D-glucan 1-alpha-D-glucosylmutase